MKTVLVSLVCALSLPGAWAQTPPSADLALPTKAGIYAVDSSSHSAAPVRLHASEVHYNRHTGNNMARNQFFINSKTTLDLEGKAAETSLALGNASFLVPADAESPELSLARLTLVRLQPMEDKRILAAMKANFLGGSPGRTVDAIAIRKETLPGGEWVRVTPTTDLPAGEYAIAFFPADPRMFPDSVYDFHVGDYK